jgi:hypothetical protein
MRLPCLQFTIKSFMVSLAVVVSLAYTLLTPDGCYVGWASVPLRFVVLHDSDGQPVQGASIHLIPENKAYPAYAGITDHDGRADMVILAPALGRSRKSRVVMFPWELTITHDGHAPLSKDLAGVMKALGSRSEDVPFVIVLRLQATAVWP